MSDKERASHQVRLITRAGVPTVERRGLPRRPLGDLYHGLMRAHWGTLAVLVVGGYLVANVLFALLYLACGDGIVNARPGNFTDAFFFSVQTMATIGYGQLAPATFAAHVI